MHGHNNRLEKQKINRISWTAVKVYRVGSWSDGLSRKFRRENLTWLIWFCVNERLVAENNKSLCIAVVFSDVPVKSTAADQFTANGVEIQIIINIRLIGKRTK